MPRRLLFVALSVFALALPRAAADHATAKAVFQKLQSLAGDWQGQDADGMAVKTTFKVVISDTAVMETISPHGMEEMMTVYSVDRDGIALIHYCPTNNQPHMRVVPASSDPKELSFDFLDAGNLPSPNAGHQHHLVFRFDDADHITETWTWRANGKDTPMVFHLARRK